MTPTEQSHPVPSHDSVSHYSVVILESPFAGDVEANLDYARACLRDCISRGEAPFASHLLYTQPGVLNDDVPDERVMGIEAGMAVAARCDATVVYTDRGISRGMIYGIENAKRAGRHISYRTLEGRLFDIDGDNLNFSDAEGLEMGLHFMRQDIRKESISRQQEFINRYKDKELL